MEVILSPAGVVAKAEIKWLLGRLRLWPHDTICAFTVRVPVIIKTRRRKFLAIRFWFCRMKIKIIRERCKNLSTFFCRCWCCRSSAVVPYLRRTYGIVTCNRSVVLSATESISLQMWIKDILFCANDRYHIQSLSSFFYCNHIRMPAWPDGQWNIFLKMTKWKI